MHGLLGSADNWRRLAKQLGEQFHVFSLDLRNHGDSFHAPGMTYSEMAHDIFSFMDYKKLEKVMIIGHSMGGKVAMQCVNDSPDRFIKAVVVDIAPKSYEAHHDVMLSHMLSLDLVRYQTLSSVDDALSLPIPDKRIRQFVMKNLNRTEEGVFYWRHDVQAIMDGYGDIMAAPLLSVSSPIEVPTLFVSGEFSDYIQSQDHELIERFFSKVTIKQMDGVGHWVQAEDPDGFMGCVGSFLVS